MENLSFIQIIEKNNLLTRKVIKEVNSLNKENHDKIAQLCDRYAQFLCDSVYMLETLATERETRALIYPDEEELCEYAIESIRNLKNILINNYAEFEESQRDNSIPTTTDYFFLCLEPNMREELGY